MSMSFIISSIYMAESSEIEDWYEWEVSGISVAIIINITVESVILNLNIIFNIQLRQLIKRYKQSYCGRVQTTKALPFSISDGKIDQFED